MENVLKSMEGNLVAPTNNFNGVPVLRLNHEPDNVMVRALTLTSKRPSGTCPSRT